MRYLAWAVLLVSLLLSAGCGGGGESEVQPPTFPDESHRWPYPPAEELCGAQTTWPDDVRFVTAKQVIRQFKEKSGYALQRHKILDIPGARTFVEVRDASTFDVYGDFVLDAIDPKCPALIEWLGVDGQPGPGGLVWEHVVAYGVPEGCWQGSKRYPRSNLVVSWSGSWQRRVNAKWKQLDAVLRQITRGR